MADTEAALGHDAHSIIMALVKATEWGPSEVCDNEDKHQFYLARDKARQWLIDVADAALPQPATADPQQASDLVEPSFEQRQASRNRISWRMKFEELATSHYPDDDEIKVPIRFGDIRAAIAALTPAPSAVEAERDVQTYDGLPFGEKLHQLATERDALRAALKRIAEMNPRTAMMSASPMARKALAAGETQRGQ